MLPYFVRFLLPNEEKYDHRGKNMFSTMRKSLLSVVYVFVSMSLACGAVDKAGTVAAPVKPDTGAVASPGASSCGFAVIDSQRVFEEYYKVKELRNELTSKMIAVQSEAIRLNDEAEKTKVKLEGEIKDLNDKIESPVVSEEVKNGYREEIKAKETALKNYRSAVDSFRQEAGAQFVQLQESRSMEVMEEVKKVVAEKAKKEGLCMVFNGSDPNIFYFDDSLANISDAIIAQLNADAPKSSVSVATPAGSGSILDGGDEFEMPKAGDMDVGGAHLHTDGDGHNHL
jgi:Skp family chaperone for outer membrane proteins